MAKSKNTDIIQAVDGWIDREYYKISSGFIFYSKTIVRSDKIGEWKEWDITCENMPDVIFVNGLKYKLSPIKK